MDKYRIDELFVGQYCEKEFLINEEMGVEFAKISQDFNPIHLDYEEAKKSRFGKKIVHGMLIGSYFSGMIGNVFPGAGSIYLGQNILFKHPVYYDMRIRIRVEIQSIDRVKKHILLKTQCYDWTDKLLVDGEAKILFE